MFIPRLKGSSHISPLIYKRENGNIKTEKAIRHYLNHVIKMIAENEWAN